MARFTGLSMGGSIQALGVALLLTLLAACGSPSPSSSPSLPASDPVRPFDSDDARLEARSWLVNDLSNALAQYPGAPAAAVAQAVLPWVMQPQDPRSATLLAKWVDDQGLVPAVVAELPGSDAKALGTHLSKALERLRPWAAQVAGLVVCERGQPTGQLNWDAVLAFIRAHDERLSRFNVGADVEPPPTGLEDLEDRALRGARTLIQRVASAGTLPTWGPVLALPAEVQKRWLPPVHLELAIRVQGKQPRWPVRMPVRCDSSGRFQRECWLADQMVIEPLWGDVAIVRSEPDRVQVSGLAPAVVVCGWRDAGNDRAHPPRSRLLWLVPVLDPQVDPVLAEAPLVVVLDSSQRLPAGFQSGHVQNGLRPSTNLGEQGVIVLNQVAPEPRSIAGTWVAPVGFRLQVDATDAGTIFTWVGTDGSHTGVVLPASFMMGQYLEGRAANGDYAFKCLSLDADGDQIVDVLHWGEWGLRRAAPTP